jgi:hypothetical protein
MPNEASDTSLKSGIAFIILEEKKRRFCCRRYLNYIIMKKASEYKELEEPRIQKKSKWGDPAVNISSISSSVAPSPAAASFGSHAKTSNSSGLLVLKIVCWIARNWNRQQKRSST